MMLASPVGRTFASDGAYHARLTPKHWRRPMRRSLALLTALTALACFPTAGYAQSASEPPRKPAVDEEAASAVDSAVLDQCRQRADAQKLREEPERKAFMGTCVTPED
jgi:hypothetical protein